MPDDKNDALPPDGSNTLDVADEWLTESTESGAESTADSPQATTPEEQAESAQESPAEESEDPLSKRIRDRQNWRFGTETMKPERIRRPQEEETEEEEQPQESPSQAKGKGGRARAPRAPRNRRQGASLADAIKSRLGGGKATPAFQPNPPTQDIPPVSEPEVEATGAEDAQAVPLAELQIERPVRPIDAVDQPVERRRPVDQPGEGFLGFDDPKTDIDELTGLMTRKSGERLINGLLADAKMKNTEDVQHLVFLDLDGFKDINDKFGHPEGDKLLRSASMAFQNTLRGDAVIIRWGGDEFVIVVRDTHKEHLTKIISRLTQAGRSVAVRFSYGIATMIEGDTLESFIARADQQMYQMKRDNKQKGESSSSRALDKRIAIPNALWGLAGPSASAVFRAVESMAKELVSLTVSVEAISADVFCDPHPVGEFNGKSNYHTDKNRVSWHSLGIATTIEGLSYLDDAYGDERFQNLANKWVRSIHMRHVIGPSATIVALGNPWSDPLAKTFWPILDSLLWVIESDEDVTVCAHWHSLAAQLNILPPITGALIIGRDVTKAPDGPDHIWDLRGGWDRFTQEIVSQNKVSL